jgi:hypothetical protein
MKVHNLQRTENNDSTNHSISISKRKELESSLSWLFLTETIKEKTKGKITASMRTNDKYILILAIIGILSNIFATSFFFSFSTGKGKLI